MIIGIICEYNPFHNGHLYHLKKIKEMYKDSTIILVMSGNYTQRGDLSIIDKWDKTDIALEYGVDMVIELPFIYASQSADIFSYGAIKILKEMKVDILVFGSELGDIDILNKLASIQVFNKNYDNLVKDYIKKGFNYPTACGMALYDITGININTPNDVLGLCYIKEIIKQNANIKPICIKRTNNYNDTNLNNKITSARSIRIALKENKNIKEYIPDLVYKNLNIRYLDDYYIFIKYKILTTDISNIVGMNKELNIRINKYIYKCDNLEELINNIKSKNYSYNRIKRLMVHILVNFTLDDVNNFKDYIRILGFNNKGQIYLNKIKKDIKLPIITNYSNSNGLLDLDKKINNVLSLNLPLNKQNEVIKSEYQEKIRITIDNKE